MSLNDYMFHFFRRNYTVNMGTSLGAIEDDVEATNVALAALNVGKRVVRKTVEIVRPANTDAYGALDVIAHGAGVVPNTITGAARANGGSGRIVGATLATDQSTNTDTFRLIFLRNSYATPADNAVYQLDYAQIPDVLGWVDVGALATQGAGSDAAAAQNFGISVPFVCDSDDDDLYFVLRAVAGFTPTSEQKFYITLLIEQD